MSYSLFMYNAGKQTFVATKIKYCIEKSQHNSILFIDWLAVFASHKLWEETNYS